MVLMVSSSFKTDRTEKDVSADSRDEPLAQWQVEGAISRLADDLERETEALLAHATRAARLEVEHKTARAHAYLKATGTIAEREAKADVETEDQAFARKLAEAKHSAQVELLRSLRARLDAMRSISASVRGNL